MVFDIHSFKMRIPFVESWKCFLVIIVQANGDCSNRTTLPFLIPREIGYVLTSGQLSVSDYYLREKWYSLPNYRLSSNSSDSCGVARHWFLQNDTMPDGVGKTINATICIEDGYTCTQEFPGKIIQIMYCGPDDYLFFLPPTDASDEGYCIVPIGRSPADLPAPDISYIRPVIEISVTPDKIKRRLEFMCVFTAYESHQYYWYTIDWVLADTSGLYKLLHTWAGQQLNMSAFNESSKLTEYHLRTHNITKLGFEIACTVRAQQKNSSNSNVSDTQYSDRKFCGIQVLSKNPLVVRDTKESVISIQLTVPFDCKSNSCYLDVALFVPKTPRHCEIPSLALREDLDPCGARITPKNYSRIVNITIMNTLGKKGLSQEFDVILTVNLGDHDLFANYSLPQIKVHSLVDVNTLSGKHCYAVSDPHTKPFDHRLNNPTFESKGLGTFVMYRNKKFKTEVQIKQGFCANYNPHWDWPYCVVALAVRAGGDVYVIDLVNTKTAFVQCKDRVLSRKVRRKSAKEYMIYLPTGTEVRVSNTWYSFLEVFIYPGLHDFGETDGLCGIFDGTYQANDYCVDSEGVCTGFKVKETESLFNNTANKVLDSWRENLTMCNCPDSVKNGGSFSDKILCTQDMMNSCTLERYSEVGISECYTSRRKRDMHRYHDFNPDIQPVKETVKETSVRYRRSETVIDFDTARQLCVEEMNTTAVQMCSIVPGLDIESYFDNCASDYLASNSMEWVQIHIEGIKQTCIQYLEFHEPISPEILDQVTVINTEETNTTTPALVLSPHSVAELLQVIKDVSCIDDCNTNGDCVNGLCQCRTGYLGEDCATHETDAPDIVGIPDNGLCDLSERPCEQTAVIGKKFVDGNLQCRLVPFKVFSDNTIVKETAISARARFDTFLQVFCTLPGAKRKRRSTSDVEIDVIAKGYAVSVSNTGQIFSVEDSVLIFDSTCLDCTKTGNAFCKKKPGFCVHEGNCYNQGDTVGCYSCLEHKAGILEWSPEDCDSNSKPSDKPYWIIGVVLGAIAVIGIAVAIVKKIYSSTATVIHPNTGILNDEINRSESASWHNESYECVEQKSFDEKRCGSGNAKLRYNASVERPASALSREDTLGNIVLFGDNN